jgi:GNAT superfamily N-acetyltransferase
VAEYNGQIEGIAIWYYKYSTWKGKCVFLEDIIVTEALRGKGIGSRLFEQVIMQAEEDGVRRMEWQVLEWNEPAIHFYRKYNAMLDPEWINGKLVTRQLKELAEECKKKQSFIRS